MTDSGRNEDGHPWLKVDRLLIQIQLSFPLKNVVGLGGPLVIVLLPIEDVDHMEAEFR